MGTTALTSFKCLRLAYTSTQEAVLFVIYSLSQFGSVGWQFRGFHLAFPSPYSLGQGTNVRVLSEAKYMEPDYIFGCPGNDYQVYPDNQTHCKKDLGQDCISCPTSRCL